MSIKIQVRNKVAVNLTPEEVIVCGNSGYDVEFSFDEEWASENVKTARFVYRKGGQNYFDDVVFSGTTVKAPVLSNINYVLVGVYAGDLITSTPAVVECDKSILCGSGTHKEPTPDVYNQLIELINAGGATDEKIAAAVDSYLEKKPVNGLTSTEKNLILTLFRNAAYTSADMGAVLTQLETLWEGSGGSDDPGGDTEATLSSISATYSGGDVAVGTAVSDLTGIVVMAHYSDGTSEAVTGYTLSGTIAEGSNTITVTYGGKTTTFTVTGVSAEPIDTSPVIAYENKAYQSSSGTALPTLSDRTGMCVTELYTFSSLVEKYKELGVYSEETGDLTNSNYTPVICYFVPNTKYLENAETNGYPTSSLTRYFKLPVFCDGTTVSYASNGSCTNNVEAPMLVHHNANFTGEATANAVAFTLTLDDAEYSYAYWMKKTDYTTFPDGVNEGDIIFAGKNTKYYGMRNISEYTGE